MFSVLKKPNLITFLPELYPITSRVFSITILTTLCFGDSYMSFSYHCYLEDSYLKYQVKFSYTLWFSLSPLNDDLITTGTTMMANAIFTLIEFIFLWKFTTLYNPDTDKRTS